MFDGGGDCMLTLFSAGTVPVPGMYRVDPAGGRTVFLLCMGPPVVGHNAPCAMHNAQL